MTTIRKPRMLVTRWAAMVYGDFAPTPYALRCWIQKGKIEPAPQKVQGKWFVDPSARYKEIGCELPVSVIAEQLQAS